MFIKRDLSPIFEKAAKEFPIITLFGPRQSGKTTLAQATFTNHKYISFEDLDIRYEASKDPRGFLAMHKNEHGLILDEVQHVPDLLSYIQTHVDREKKKGYFILTGSQNFMVTQAVTQSLAGRMAILTLLPLSISELQKSNLMPVSPWELIYKGFYPSLYEQERMISLWYSSYISSYIERDVRQISKIDDLSVFKLFLKLCAGRIGQLLNVSSLANDCGITTRKAEAWLSILEASYVIKLLQPYYNNFNKRLVKTPKLYFYDVGLASSLLGIESVEQLFTHYLRGGLFENLVILDLCKEYFNAVKEPSIYFWRDNHGHEIDCIIENANTIIPIEIKSGQTVDKSFFDNLSYWNKLTDQQNKNSFIVYGGTENKSLSYGNIVSWQSNYKIFDSLYKKQT